MRILIVEDEKQIAQFLRAGLEAESFAVDVATDGERGSFLARTNDYDLIILDNILPKKTGLQVCQEVRKEGKSVPIIVLSVKSEVSTKVELLNSGADDYLSKPFSLEELMARVRALLRRPPKVEGDILQIADLVLDNKKQVVKRGAKEVYLTRKEFALLEYLLKNAGAVLSRGMIMEHVWNMSADPFSNTIESHILSLRRKIDTNVKKRLIHTIPGRGYKLSEQL
ncbi:MAG: two-component system, OmpR family, copper resistance phosphate regulon response regulator CusR [Parcubacteria group bacterium Gr01-1014_3]|nr:MAG: two-component system, OmpR family, copper resistance phosphate regulon response regulator CusR [Parcubacteria group bacterium Gr01-1014_3]